MEFAEKMALINFCLKFARSENGDHTLKTLTVAKVKLFPWKHMA